VSTRSALSIGQQQRLAGAGLPSAEVCVRRSRPALDPLASQRIEGIAELKQTQHRLEHVLRRRAACR
jgi:ABC-type phosphate transport system ATPase subunit